MDLQEIHDAIEAATDILTTFARTASREPEETPAGLLREALRHMTGRIGAEWREMERIADNSPVQTVAAMPTAVTRPCRTRGRATSRRVPVRLPLRAERPALVADTRSQAARA